MGKSAFLDSVGQFFKKNYLAVAIFGAILIIAVVGIILIVSSLSPKAPVSTGDVSGLSSMQEDNASTDNGESMITSEDVSEMNSNGTAGGSQASRPGGNQIKPPTTSDTTTVNPSNPTVKLPNPVTHDSSDSGKTPKTVLRQTAYQGYETLVTACTVQNFGAKADGKTDSTQAFQKALDYVNELGGGAVFVPAGQYVIKGGLTVFESCSLVGEWYNPNTEASKIANGTILLAYGDKGKANGTPLLKVANGSAVIGITVYYPEQSTTSPVAYPVTMQATDCVGSNNSGYPTMKYSTLVNPYRGVNFGPTWNELGVLEHVYMTPLEIGVYVNMTTDIGRIENLYISADYYSKFASGVDKDKLISYMKSKVVGLELLRSDWQYLYQSEIKDVNIGIKFSRALGAGAVDSCNSQMYDLKISNSTYGLYFTYNKTFNIFTKVNISTDKECILLQKGFSGSVSLNTATLSSKNSSCIVSNSASTGAVSLMDSTLASWKTGAYAINSSGGGIQLDNCKATGKGTTVMLGQGTTGGVINNCSNVTVNNKIGSKAAISTGKYAAANYVSQVPENLKGSCAGVSGLQMINVKDRGADSTGKTDVTGIFQKALNDLAKTGGVVYVPAGQYLLNGTLTIPTGVELRGVSLTGHHSNALGSVLYTTNGKGNENATAFITLKEKSGVRGLTIWYPTQNVNTPVKYPYAISATAKNVWVVDMTVGNGWKGLYLGANSGGHYVSYYAGFCFANDIYVDGSNTTGYISNTHTNPHFYGRTPSSLQGGNPGDFGALLGKTDGTKQGSVILGSTSNEVLFNNFNYRGGIGLKIVGDNFKGVLVGCGYDGVGKGLVVNNTGKQILMVNFQSDLVPVDPHYMVMENGNMVFINSGFSAYNFTPAGGMMINKGKAEIRQIRIGASANASGAVSVGQNAELTLGGAIFSHTGPLNSTSTDFTQQKADEVIDIISASSKLKVTSVFGKWFISVQGVSDTTNIKSYS